MHGERSGTRWISGRIQDEPLITFSSLEWKKEAFNETRVQGGSFGRNRWDVELQRAILFARGGSFPSVHRIIAKNDNELDKLSARLSIDRSAAVRANRFIIGGRVKREKRVHAFLRV